MNEGAKPDGNAAPTTSSAPEPQSEAIHKLLGARLGLPDLARRDSSRPSIRVQSHDIVTDAIDAAWSLHDSSEMTPAPMVVGTDDGTPSVGRVTTGDAPRVERSSEWHAQGRSGRGRSSSDEVASEADARAAAGDARAAAGDARAAAGDARAAAGDARAAAGDAAHSGVSPEQASRAELDSDWLGRSGPPEYYPPRPPPPSIAPPPVPCSISVAAEYDPKAPTRPKVRRNTSAPPPPLLFGMDRMLVWGLVLGGVFVATIVIIVNEFAFTSAQRREREQAYPAASVDVSGRHLDFTAAAVSPSRATPAPAIAPAVSAQERTSPARSATRADAESSLDGGTTPVATTEKPRTGVGAKSSTRPQSRPLDENNAKRKSWIE